MNAKTGKILYWIVTALALAIFAFSAIMYLTKTEMVNGFFEELNFPTWLVIPLAVGKIVGIIAVLINKQRWLTEWAYAGFFFDAVLATMAHHYAGHGVVGLSLLAILFICSSRFLYKFR